MSLDEAMKFLRDDYSLNCSLEEFEFNEKANNRIKALQSEIRTEVYNIKFLIKKLEKSFNEIEDKRLMNLGHVTHLDQFSCDLNDFTTAVLEISHYLYQQEPMINANEKDLQNLTPNKSRQNTNLVDYVNLLFKNVPIENDSFMSKICSSLQTSLQLIQSEAQRKQLKICNSN